MHPLLQANDRMRKILLMLFALVICFAAQAQNITRFEYFLDTDPGYGAGTIVNVTPAATITDFNIPVSTSALSNGFHTLYIRAQNASNEWTHTHLRSFYIVPFTASTNITQIEYFIDSDPGIGLATQVSFTAASTITNLAIDISTVPLTPGFHILYVRCKSSDGKWTHTHLRSFYIVPFVAATNITQVEYFIDTDPGVGLGTQVSFTAAPTITNLPIDISAVPLTTGFHKLYVRSKSSDGKWTHTHLRSFYVANVSATENLVKFEYFFDIDPGFDNGTSVAVTPAVPSVTNKDILADASGLSVGAHTIYIRAKDSGGEWTQVSTGSFSVTAVALPTITSFTPTSGGTGTSVTITGTNFTGATAVTFGGTAATSFTVVSSTSITAIAGTGTTGKIAVTTPTGTATSTADFTFTTPDLIVISPQPVSTAVCEGSTTSFTLAATGTTNIIYQWQKFNGTVFIDLVNGSEISGATSASLTINTSGNVGAGDYRCKVSGDGTQDKFSNVVTLTINPLPTAPGVSGATSCGASSLTLNASGGSNGQYRWYTTATGGTSLTGQVNNTYTTPVVNTTTSYFVSINNGICESTRVEVIATISTVPTAPAVTPGSTCGPGTVTLQATGGSNGQYRWYDVASGGTALAGETNSSLITPALTTNTIYYVSINNGTCESARTAVLASIFSLPTKPIITANEPITGGIIQLCQSAITLTAPVGFTYTWSNGQTTQSITNVQPGNYSVVIQDGNGCSSVSSDPIQIVLNTTCVNSPPIINTTTAQTFIGGKVNIDLSNLISDPDGNLDASSLQVVGNATQKGGKTTLSGFILEIDYASAKFSGIDLVTIRVCDLLNVCFEANLEIEVVGDIIVYSGISPNGDTKNDTWVIEYITLFPDTQSNRVTIYNRWGDLVWEGANYDNNNIVFTGLNKNGNELTTGTYFYKIEFTDRETITGYLSLKR
jgi:gliding motility-associated-like protein